MSGLRLVPLRCPACAEPLAVTGRAGVLFCAGCAGAFEVAADGALAAIPISFARRPDASVPLSPLRSLAARVLARLPGASVPRSRLRSLAARVLAVRPEASETLSPFWSFAARLELRERESKGGSGYAEDGLAAVFAQLGTLRFYVAAYLADLEDDNRWSLRLTREQPQLAAVPAPPALAGLDLSQGEARLMAQDVFASSEIRGSGLMRRLEFDLQLDDPRLVIVAR